MSVKLSLLTFFQWVSIFVATYAKRTLPRPPSERRGDIRLAYVCMVLCVWSPRLCVYYNLLYCDWFSLASASEYPSRVNKQDRISCRLAYVCMVPLWTYCTIWQAVPRITASPRWTNFDSLALASTARHCLASRMCECPFNPYCL